MHPVSVTVEAANVQAAQIRADLAFAASCEGQLAALKARHAVAVAKAAAAEQRQADLARQEKERRAAKHAQVVVKVRQPAVLKSASPARGGVADTFRRAVLAEVKAALTEPYKQGHVNRDAYKKIAAKATEKVVSAGSRHVCLLRSPSLPLSRRVFPCSGVIPVATQPANNVTMLLDAPSFPRACSRPLVRSRKRSAKRYAS